MIGLCKPVAYTIKRLLLEEELRRSNALLDQSQVDDIADLVFGLLQSGMLINETRLDSSKSADMLVARRSVYCRPAYGGVANKNSYLVKFEDPGVGDQFFDDEGSARAFFEMACENWNCYLFELVKRRGERD